MVITDEEKRKAVAALEADEKAGKLDAAEEAEVEEPAKSAEDAMVADSEEDDSEGDPDSEGADEEIESTDTTGDGQEDDGESAGDESDDSATVTLKVHGEERRHTLAELKGFAEQHLGGMQKFEETRRLKEEVEKRQEVLDRTSRETVGIDADGALVLKFIGETLRDDHDLLDDVLTRAIERQNPNADEKEVDGFREAVILKLRELGNGGGRGRSVIHATLPEEAEQSRRRIKSVMDNELPGYLDRKPLEMLLPQVVEVADRMAARGEVFKDSDLSRIVRIAANEIDPDLYDTAREAGRKLKAEAPDRKTKAKQAAKAVGGSSRREKVDSKIDFTDRSPEGRKKVAESIFKGDWGKDED